MNNFTSGMGRILRQTLQRVGNTRNVSRTPVTRSMEGMGDKHIPTPFEKKVLVWSKMYKSIDEVPKNVSYATMRKGKDLMRIRVNIGMGVATVIGCIVVITYSKKKQGKGDSLQNRGLQWEADMKAKGVSEKSATSGSST